MCAQPIDSEPVSGLRISLFGSVRVRHGRAAPEVPLTRGARSLLAYLVLQRQRRHPREVLVELFWGDQPEERARNCLNTALWRLRRVLEPRGTTRGTYLLSTASGEVGFNPGSEYWLDVAVFEAATNRLRTAPDAALDEDAAASVAAALALYRGDLLDGVYHDWALRERERLRLLYLNALGWLMRFHRERGATAESIAYGQQILNHDPLREEVHRELIRMYLERGQRGLAVHQYDECRAVLVRELGIEPLEETRRLCATARNAAPAVVTPRPGGADVQGAVTQLQAAMSAFEDARRALEAAIERMQQVPDLTVALAAKRPTAASR